MQGQWEYSSGCVAASGVVSASWGVRSLRAAVFAVLCVLLASGGHVLAMGVAPPVWVQLAGVVPVFLVGCLLGGRERSLVGIGSGTLATQGGLHLAFGAARPHATLAMHSGWRSAPRNSWRDGREGRIHGRPASAAEDVAAGGGERGAEL
jgi:hypothetical protein